MAKENTLVLFALTHTSCSLQFLFLHFATPIKASQILLHFYTLEDEQDWLQTCFGLLAPTYNMASKETIYV